MKPRSCNNIIKKYRLQRAMSRLQVARAKRKLLESYGWYRNVKGGYCHPHGMDYMSAAEIHSCTLHQLEFKLKRGSMAKIPGNV